MHLDAGLLRAVLETPADDTPRLVLADHLDDQGDDAASEYAALIRLQCRMAAMEEDGSSGPVDPNEGHTCSEDPCPVCTTIDEYKALLVHEWLLVYNLCFKSRVFAQLLPAADYHSVSVSAANPSRLHYDSRTDSHRVTLMLRRGFPSSLTLPTAAFLQHAAALFAAAPVTTVTLSDIQSVRNPGHAGGRTFDPFDAELVPEYHRFGQRVPRELLVLLRQFGGRSYQPTDCYVEFSTPAAALSALSSACVAFGRHAAGLPALTPSRPPAHAAAHP